MARFAPGPPSEGRTLLAILRALVALDPLRWAHRNVHYFDESLKSREEAEERVGATGVKPSAVWSAT